MCIYIYISVCSRHFFARPAGNTLAACMIRRVYDDISLLLLSSLLLLVYDIIMCIIFIIIMIEGVHGRPLAESMLAIVIIIISSSSRSSSSSLVVVVVVVAILLLVVVVVAASSLQRGKADCRGAGFSAEETSPFGRAFATSYHYYHHYH